MAAHCSHRAAASQIIFAPTTFSRLLRLKKPIHRRALREPNIFPAALFVCAAERHIVRALAPKSLQIF
jgi:hypothetical protein